MDGSILAPEAALRALLDRSLALVDVRSEGEFAQGQIPGSVCLPILGDAERAAVGTSYKQIGQAAAIALGFSLFNPQRAVRVAAWRAALHSEAQPLRAVMCWRGGMRSGYAAQFLREDGETVATVAGGYQALRRLLLERIAQPAPLCVIAGPTGSGKTDLLRLLQEAPHPSCGVLDLEALAVHRGSAFGAYPGSAQPRQASFENGIGLALSACAGRERIFVEDESRLIGACSLPPALFAALQAAPIVSIEAPLPLRVSRVLADYVQAPLSAGMPADALRERLRNSITALRRRLGGALQQELERDLDAAFAAGEIGAHRKWIEGLLTRYYDPAYERSLARQARTQIFRGSLEECHAWIRSS